MMLAHVFWGHGFWGHGHSVGGGAFLLVLLAVICVAIIAALPGKTESK